MSDNPNKVRPYDAVPVLRDAGREVERRRTHSEPAISYLDVAPASAATGLPLVLLHGVGSASDTWRRLIPCLDRRRIIAPDYRGHGLSVKPQPPYSLDDFIGDALRLADDLALGRFHVCGFSLGALFAARLAVLRPDRMASLVLLNSIASRSATQKEAAHARLEFLTGRTPAETAPAAAQRWFTPGFLSDETLLVQDEIAITADTDHAAYVASYRVLVENDPLDDADAINCPTLIVTGEHDVGSTPSMSRALHERIAGSRLTVIKDVKHYIHLEKPEALASLINEFLASVERAA